MTKVVATKKNNILIQTMNKKYGMGLKYKSDKELHKALIKKGLPSLSKLLKMTVRGA